MNNECRWQDEQLVDFVDGSLSKFQANEIALHLKKCKNCAEKVSEWQEILENTDEAVQPSPFLKPRINRNLRLFINARRRGCIYLSAVILVASFLFLLATVNLFSFHKTADSTYLVKQKED